MKCRRACTEQGRSFSRSHLDLTPDLLLLGKATSDMMFPFALTLYSAAVQDMLERRGSDLADSIKKRYGYEQGYKTVVNVLRLGEESDVSRQVADAGALFAQLLKAWPGFQQDRARRARLWLADRHRARHPALAAPVAAQAALLVLPVQHASPRNTFPCWRAFASMNPTSSRSRPRSMSAPTRSGRPVPPLSMS